MSRLPCSFGIHEGSLHLSTHLLRQLRQAIRILKCFLRKLHTSTASEQSAVERLRTRHNEDGSTFFLTSKRLKWPLYPNHFLTIRLEDKAKSSTLKKSATKESISLTAAVCDRQIPWLRKTKPRIITQNAAPTTTGKTRFQGGAGFLFLLCLFMPSEQLNFDSKVLRGYEATVNSVSPEGWLHWARL